MKSASALTLLFSLAIVPGVALAELVASLDFTGGAGAWTIQVTNPGDPSPYPVTYELDGDPTKYGYEENTTDTGYVQMYQVVSAPVGFTMSNIQVDAKVSGYSSWNMLGRFGLGINTGFCTACAPYWTGSDHGGASHVDLPLTLDASGDPNFTDVASVVIHTEVWKGLNAVWLPVNVSDIRVSATLTSTTPGPEPVDFAAVTVNDVVGLSFTGEVDNLYLLQYTTSLVSTQWLDTESFVRGTGGESFVFDPAGISTQKNYRIVEALP